MWVYSIVCVVVHARACESGVVELVRAGVVSNICAYIVYTGKPCGVCPCESGDSHIIPKKG